MAVVNVCDKCGLSVGGPVKKCLTFLGFKLDEYRYSYYYEMFFCDNGEECLLCASCGKELRKWLNTPKKKE